MRDSYGRLSGPRGNTCEEGNLVNIKYAAAKIQEEFEADPTNAAAQIISQLGAELTMQLAEYLKQAASGENQTANLQGPAIKSGDQLHEELSIVLNKGEQLNPPRDGIAATIDRPSELSGVPSGTCQVTFRGQPRVLMGAVARSYAMLYRMVLEKEPSGSQQKIWQDLTNLFASFAAQQIPGRDLLLQASSIIQACR